MPDGFPVTITDDDGDTIEVNPYGDCVRIETPGRPVELDAGQCERLAQAIVAASWAADRMAGPVRDPAEPPLHYDEGITGMYWDNLGSVGDG